MSNHRSITTNKELKYCPNCKNSLYDNKELAQHVKECIACGNRFYIMLTSSNNYIKNTIPLYNIDVNAITKEDIDAFTNAKDINDLPPILKNFIQEGLKDFTMGPRINYLETLLLGLKHSK